ncbi:MAG: recombination regulator RecX [Rhodoferax sp.]|nr:recombination regulator RecX [Rhodoferax sp.]
MAQTPLSLTGRALRLLSRREHSRAELERKLAAHQEQPGTLAQVLDKLAAKGFINESRVVESVIHRRSARLGTQRIKQELQAKGLEPEAVSQAVRQLQRSEVTRAREVWRKKFGSPAQNAAERAKHMRFLSSRGFDAEAIRRVVAGGGNGE